MDTRSTLVAYLTSGFNVILGSITLEKFAVIVGIATALATFLLNWYYRAREDERQARRDADK